MKSIEQQLSEQAGRPLPKPVKPVFVLDNGIRVPFDMRFAGVTPVFGATWSPIIEGEIARLMPRIVGLDAEEWPPDCAIKFPNIVSEEWTHRLLANSPILKRVKHNARTHTREPKVEYLREEE